MTSTTNFISDSPSPRTGGFSSFASLRALYFLTLRQHLHGKRWMVMALLFLLPAILALVVRDTAVNVPAINIEFVFVYMFIPQALLPLIALIYSSGIILDEQEEQTITYLLIRPISKWKIYVTKLLAVLTTTVCLTAIFTTLTYIAVYAGDHTSTESIPLRCLKTIPIHALAVITYCCLFSLISFFASQVLVVGILYTAIFEGLFANLNFGVRLLSVIFYARLIAYHTLSFVGIMGGQPHDIAAEVWQLDTANDPKLLAYPQFSICIIVLVSTSIACAILSALICKHREFHVKTPERSAS